MEYDLNSWKSVYLGFQLLILAQPQQSSQVDPELGLARPQLFVSHMSKCVNFKYITYITICEPGKVVCWCFKIFCSNQDVFQVEQLEHCLYLYLNPQKILNQPDNYI